MLPCGDTAHEIHRYRQRINDGSLLSVCMKRTNVYANGNNLLCIYKKMLIVAICGERDRNSGAAFIFHITFYTYTFFLFSTKLTGYLGPGTKKLSRFFLPTSQLKKKANINFLPDELLPITKINDEDGRKIWRNAYHVK